MTDKQIIIDAFNSAWNRKVATESSYGKLASKEVFENNNEDKQIIIDGVDVSGCGYIDHDSTWCDLCMTNCAKETKPCYYKQLKRKEQECEELKRYLNQIRDEELSHLDIEWDEYQTCNRQTDYSNIVTLVERALGEIND